MDGRVLNLSGPLYGKFRQHLDARYVVPWLGGHFVPRPELQVDVPYQIQGRLCLV